MQLFTCIPNRKQTDRMKYHVVLALAVTETPVKPWVRIGMGVVSHLVPSAAASQLVSLENWTEVSNPGVLSTRRGRKLASVGTVDAEAWDVISSGVNSQDTPCAGNTSHQIKKGSSAEVQPQALRKLVKHEAGQDATLSLTSTTDTPVLHALNHRENRADTKKKIGRLWRPCHQFHSLFILGQCKTIRQTCAQITELSSWGGVEHSCKCWKMYTADNVVAEDEVVKSVFPRLSGLHRDGVPEGGGFETRAVGRPPVRRHPEHPEQRVAAVPRSAFGPRLRAVDVCLISGRLPLSFHPYQAGGINQGLLLTTLASPWPFDKGITCPCCRPDGRCVTSGVRGASSVRPPTETKQFLGDDSVASWSKARHSALITGGLGFEFYGERQKCLAGSYQRLVLVMSTLSWRQDGGDRPRARDGTRDIYFRHCS
ncbi:hypothetical protein RRG08_044313 [Elysia crispata]|uniref:Uncharacterized protein n=1 Tax=Elysia crispata TaxID=231223 RepID=A0AAE0XXT9_9GAST|nr:hypothetical protein RRG08_044313 [Elysia crispata]